jgi:hypothetical protein
VSTSPVDLQAELASWLWERQVFERRDNETVLLVPTPAAPPSEPSRRWILGAVACGVAALGILLIDVRPEPGARAPAGPQHPENIAPLPAASIISGTPGELPEPAESDHGGPGGEEDPEAEAEAEAHEKTGTARSDKAKSK